MHLHNQEFELIVSNITNNEHFKELDNEFHHGISRYGHVLRVAKGVYKVTKILGFNYEEATKAALLHDFYFNYQVEDKTAGKTLVEHANLAVLNAQQYFGLTKREENMIAAHMFPLGSVLPKYKESICLTIVDKVVALYEQNRYKVGMKLGVYFLFILNMITLQK